VILSCEKEENTQQDFSTTAVFNLLLEVMSSQHETAGLHVSTIYPADDLKTLFL